MILLLLLLLLLLLIVFLLIDAAGLMVTYIDALPVCSSNNTFFVSAQTTLWFAGENQNCPCTSPSVSTVNLTRAIKVTCMVWLRAGVQKIKEK